ncbi:hypothetical protein ACFLTH_04195 [Bacteroidota bacterium]
MNYQFMTFCWCRFGSIIVFLIRNVRKVMLGLVNYYQKDMSIYLSLRLESKPQSAQRVEHKDHKD